MAVRVLYFGWVREAIGIDGETANGDFRSLADLVDHLEARGGGYSEAFADRTGLRFALNQHLAAIDAPLSGGEEAAIFPPVTGG